MSFGSISKFNVHVSIYKNNEYEKVVFKYLSMRYVGRKVGI